MLGVVVILMAMVGLSTVTPASATGTSSVLAVTDTIHIQSPANALAVSPDGTRLYVTEWYANSTGVLRIIDTATTTVLRSITVGAYPAAVVVSPNGSRVYVANVSDGTVSVINTTTNRVIRTITVGTTPRNFAMNASGSRLYVANTGSSTISVINTANNSVTSTIGVDGLNSVAVSPDGTRLYVTNGRFHGGSLYVVTAATGAITDTISVGAMPAGLAVTPDGGRIYVTYQDGNNLTVVNAVTKSVTTNITIGWNASRVAVSADGTRVYAPNADDWNMSVIDTSDDTVIETVATGPDATNLAVSPDGQRIYVGNPQTNSVLVFSELASSAPTALSATPGDGSASISFTPGDAASIQKYQFSVDGGTTWSDADDGTTSPVTVHGLRNGATYALKLRSVSVSDVGGASASVSVTPELAGPAQTCSFSVLGPRGKNACWNALSPNQGTVTKYQVSVLYAGTPDLAWSAMTTNRSFLVRSTSLSSETDYDLRVRARVQDGTRAYWSLYSAAVSFRTK